MTHSATSPGLDKAAVIQAGAWARVMELWFQWRPRSRLKWRSCTTRIPSSTGQGTGSSTFSQQSDPGSWFNARPVALNLRQRAHRFTRTIRRPVDAFKTGMLTKGRTLHYIAADAVRRVLVSLIFVHSVDQAVRNRKLQQSSLDGKESTRWFGGDTHSPSIAKEGCRCSAL